MKNQLNNLTRSGKYKSLHGTYIPTNKQKYKGVSLPRFKSKLELKMMMYLDKSPSVIEWTYEPFAIKYFDRSPQVLDKINKPVERKYYIDFIATIQNGAVVKKYWIEIKSKNEVLVDLKKCKNVTEACNYVKNMSKWTTARKLAQSKGFNFKIITDKDLK